MRRYLPVGLICLVVLTAVFVFMFVVPERASSARLFQEDLPREGWTVCEVGGLVYIPDIGAERQIMALCHADGWRYQAYCLQPLLPVPPLNTMCSILDNNLVWCGDEVQQLRLYALLQPPEAPETLTPTHTSTSTATSTSTSTSTATSTATMTSTATATNTSTATATMTSTSTITPFPIEVTETSTPTRTGTPVLPDERERPGGPGNVEVAAFLTAVLAAPAMLTAARAWSLRRRKSARP